MHQTVFASLLIHMMAGMAGTVEERRIDPYDSQSCTLDEVKKKYSLLSEVEILDYWESEMTLDPKQKACKPADAPPVADGENSQDLQRLARLRNLQTVAADNSKQDAIKPGNPPPDERREDPQDGNIYKVEKDRVAKKAAAAEAGKAEMLRHVAEWMAPESEESMAEIEAEEWLRTLMVAEQSAVAKQQGAEDQFATWKDPHPNWGRVKGPEPWRRTFRTAPYHHSE